MPAHHPLKALERYQSIVLKPGAGTSRLEAIASTSLQKAARQFMDRQLIERKSLKYIW